MPLANVSLLDSYALWLTRFNQSITYLNTFDANNITFVSNTPALTFAGTGRLGSNVYIDIAGLSTNPTDEATTNIASANLVFVGANKSNNAYNRANSAYTQGNNAYNYANTVGTIANNAYTVANNALANTSGVVFAGDLIITGNLTISGGIVNLL